MSNKAKAFIFSALLFGLSFSALAQMKIYVAPSTQDIVGSRLVYAIKEGIRRSSGMSLVDRDEDSALTVNIVTLDPDQGSQMSSTRTIYSVVWTVKTFHATPVDMYLTNSVGLCGAGKVSECADTLVANTDEQATKVGGWLRSAIEKSKQSN